MNVPGQCATGRKARPVQAGASQALFSDTPYDGTQDHPRMQGSPCIRLRLPSLPPAQHALAQRWIGPYPKLNRNCIMSLVSLVVTLIVVGILLWLVNTYLPMDRKIKTILNVVVVIFVILWILNGTGLLGGLNGITVGG
jgi:hypothetical protein